MAEWSRLRETDVPLMAIVELVRDGYLVSIRLEDDGMPGDIIASGVGRTVDAAYNRAMGEVEKLSVEAEAEAAQQRKRQRRR